MTKSCNKAVFITYNHAVIICTNSGCVPALSAAKTLCITWRGIFQQNDLIFPSLVINNNDVHIRIRFTMQKQRERERESMLFLHNGEK